MRNPRNPTSSGLSRDEILAQLIRLPRRSARIEALRAYPELRNAETVAWLCDVVRERARVNTSEVIPIAELAMAIASHLRKPDARARSLRAMGNALHVSGNNAAAISHHEKAKEIFFRIGDQVETARTLSASIQPLILTGKYKKALANAGSARRIFTAQRDKWRVGRLDLNTGNIFHRQDQFAKALQWYRRAYRGLSADAEKDPEATAVALHNIAMCLVSLNDFHGALTAHEQARTFAQKHGMQLLVGQADYNIADLYHFRGQYNRAINLLLATREACIRNNDSYHVALCLLDLSEIYLELNLCHPAEEMAREASAAFEKLGMGYEAGKSLVNLALALAQQGQPVPALDMLVDARRRFVKEKNLVWPFLCDLYRAAILIEQKRHSEAQKLCLTANKFFRTAKIPSNMVFCGLLLARSYLLSGQIESARRAGANTLAVLDKFDLPVLACSAHQLMAQTHRARGGNQDAYDSYQQARRLLDRTRGGLRSDESKMSFTADKLGIYEGLVELCLEADVSKRPLEEAFEHIEQSKSRSLQDLMSNGSGEYTSKSGSDADRDAVDLRTEINWHSRRLSEEQLRGRQASAKVMTDLQTTIRKKENQLLRLLREIPTSEAVSSGFSKPATIEEIRESLPAAATLLEYFQIRNRLWAVLLSQDSFKILPVADVDFVAPILEKLRFQFDKFRLGAEYIKTFESPLLSTTQQYLRTLYDELMLPVTSHISAQHLVIVPHGILHYLPFQALFDGNEYLIDKFTLSYAPSATVYRLCHNTPANDLRPGLVLGVPDATAPLIREEAIAVAEIIRGSELFLDQKATAAILRDRGSRSRVVHIAAHGHFRSDSPMFSGIQLGDGLLSLLDLYQFKLSADLITLSGCATGVSTVESGDELLGLVRGLISAGAKSALLTLWDVQDASTVDFMKAFYRLISSGTGKAKAVQQAAWKTRETYPHPFYWAPFSLVGNV